MSVVVTFVGSVHPSCLDRLPMSTFIIRCQPNTTQDAKRHALRAAQHAPGLRIVDDTSENMLLVEGDEPAVRELAAHCAFAIVEPLHRTARPSPVRAKGRRM